ncbi:MAG: MucB/RseB C-terminal domain-containing protein [Pasteurellaceae bacterium]|nr:MucB/RseB C-terminal domain-containing protein [Pasteurellaceae bacterium]
MKRKLGFRLLLCLLFCNVWLGNIAFAEEKLSPLAYLNAMTNAHRTLNYEQLYILQQGEIAISLRYRHAYVNGKEYAQLLRLDNAREEIILRDNRVSYFGEFQPFSLQANQILDDLPSVLYTDFEQLTGYVFIDAGRTRVADRLARVIRVIPRDEFRYQYELWIDEENHLLLRSDLLDRERQILEQFKVIQSVVESELSHIVEPIDALILPALISSPQKPQPVLHWRLGWVPDGFNLVALSEQHLSEMWLDEKEPIESQFYRDGLFSFTIYLVRNKDLIFDEQFLRQGKTSIYSQTIGDNDVVIIGDIPLVSARHIVHEIQFSQKVGGSPPLAEGQSK